VGGQSEKNLNIRMTPLGTFKNIFFNILSEVCSNFAHLPQKLVASPARENALASFFLYSHAEGECMISKEVLVIDGAYGEGGGQILRSALALSLILEKPFKMTNIRSGRERPGLQRQHLTVVKACQEISNAEVKGADLNSGEIEFIPKQIRHGKLRFDTSTAASTTLILQGLAPALIFAGGKTTLEIIGGTNNPMAPSVMYIQKVFLPMLKEIGAQVGVSVDKYGWYPKGGGVLHVDITPINELKSVSLMERGVLQSVLGIALISNLPKHIAEREKKQCLKNLFNSNPNFEQMSKIEIIEAPSIGQGTELFLQVRYEHSIAGFNSLGEIKKPAEKLADEVCKEFIRFNESNATVDSHLADQILIYLALAKGKSSLITSRISNHLITNAWLIKQFLPDAKIEISGEIGEKGELNIEGIGFKNKYLK
jgi:RNA 3'-terminal phosphate cyclase (ATP)